MVGENSIFRSRKIISRPEVTMAKDKVSTGEKPFGVEFVLGGLAGIGIGLITNPADTLKTRLQLQGELAAPGSYTKTYRSTLDAARQIARNEGILAFQAGLAPVLGLQVIVNTMRLGSYYFAKKHGLTVNEDGGTNVVKTAALSGISGSLAFIIGSPLYVVKVKLQALPDAKRINNQTINTRMIIKALWKEGGFKSLYRAWNANIPRLFIGSAVQLTCFGLTMDELKTIKILSERPILTTFIASAISGTILTFSAHPFDVMSTRLNNQGNNSQGRGVLYNGMFDTLYKIIKTESFLGLYKGVFPNWLRLTPYSVCGLILYEKLSQFYEKFIL